EQSVGTSAGRVGKGGSGFGDGIAELRETESGIHHHYRTDRWSGWHCQCTSRRFYQPAEREPADYDFSGESNPGELHAQRAGLLEGQARDAKAGRDGGTWSRQIDVGTGTHRWQHLSAERQVLRS